MMIMRSYYRQQKIRMRKKCPTNNNNNNNKVIQPREPNCDGKTSSRSLRFLSGCWFCDVGVMLFFTASVMIFMAATGATNLSSSIIIEQTPYTGGQSSAQLGGQLLPTTDNTIGLTNSRQLGAHLQPASVLWARNRSMINFTHVTYDELTGSVYVGATNWLLQLSATDLRPEVALKTGPASSSEFTRDCAPADCKADPQLVDLHSFPLVQHAAHAHELALPFWPGSTNPAASTWRTADTRRSYGGGGGGANGTIRGAIVGGGRVSGSLSLQLSTNNYNKLLLIEPESRQLLVCGSLSQGACRKHQLGQLGNFSELIPLPVTSNDEHSSTVALVGGAAPRTRPLLYVAATNSRLGPYREMVPAISARHLADHPSGSSMQIVERSFTETARVDISLELRDYYLVHYVSAFQHLDFIYFATVQRRSPLRQLEEWGYISRLARLCAGDLSFQSYVEMTLECVDAKGTNYNLLQDAYLAPASSHLAQNLKLTSSSSPILVAVFAQSKDHSMKTQRKSALCLYPMEQIEAKFAENIDLCFSNSTTYTGITQKTRNMNYIAGSVNNCPKSGSSSSLLEAATNSCSEPLKLNGSLALTKRPLLSYENELLSAVAASQIPTSPLAGSSPFSPLNSPIQRHHQLILLGTGDGALKRVSLITGEDGELEARELEHIQVADNLLATQETSTQDSPILADLHLSSGSGGQQFLLASTPNKLVRLRADGCKAQRRNNSMSAATPGTNDQCHLCAQLADPSCGWCWSAHSCLARADCASLAQANKLAPHWTPFDQIRCADYQPISPSSLPVQAPHGQLVEVNVRLRPASSQATITSQLNQPLAQFICHFDYLAHSDRALPAPRPSGATTSALQARLSSSTSTLSIGCPLPAQAHRPAHSSSSASAEQKVRLSVRPLAPQQQALDLLSQASAGIQLADSADLKSATQSNQLERELILYDCSALTTCRSCLSLAGAQCAWCPLSSRCTFNSSHPELGCAASAIASTTPLSSTSHTLRGSHTLTASLDEAQASVLSLSLNKLDQCPSDVQSNGARRPPADNLNRQSISASALAEILVPSGARKSLQLQLSSANSNMLMTFQRNNKYKIECQLELEGVRIFRMSAKWLSTDLVLCQETLFSYTDEVASLRARLQVVVLPNNEQQSASVTNQQLLDTFNVILYKCHLFGVNPPALTSLVGAHQHSSAAWPRGPAHDFLRLATRPHSRPIASKRPRPSSDCSLCANVERKYQCTWCGNQCQHVDQCATGEPPSTSCPAPRIDSIHPTSGPLEGGTLLTIEGSNLGATEREIQDKISVAGEPCQLVMYSVSTRIVCKTGPSLHGPQAATVFVGNRAGVTSAHEKFHYKAIHLTDVNPRVGPVSGGTRLHLTGSNLNVGSRLQIFLDDIPCALDGQHEGTGSQISCITAPNLLAYSTRITRLTLIIDNSTHYLPYPFTYQPDPIISSIEPAESFLSGGRLILIRGQHLTSPQSSKLMVYHEHLHTIINGTSCITQNDTLITCLTPALSREILASASNTISNHHNHQHSSIMNNLLYESGGLKLKMSLFMDDVRAVRNLDEYYHHLPHYLTYFLDPQLFPIPTQQPIEFNDNNQELIIPGENLKMKQLEQDMLITIGNHICPIKSISSNQVICELPTKVSPIYDDSGRLVDRPILPIVALIGTNLRYHLGHMQYHSRHYQTIPNLNQQNINDFLLSNFNSYLYPMNSPALFEHQVPSNTLIPSSSLMSDDTGQSSSVTILLSLSIFGFILGFAATFMFALGRFRQSKAEREYKRIQLQMGSLDINGQPFNPTSQGLFAACTDNFHINSNSNNNNNNTNNVSRAARALECALNDPLAGKKLFYQLNQPSFPPSPLTDVSSLTGSNPIGTHQQHLVKLSSNGTIINSTSAITNHHHHHHLHQQKQQQHNKNHHLHSSHNYNHSLNNQHQYNTANSVNSSSQSSPGSTRNSNNLFSPQLSSNSQAAPQPPAVPTFANSNNLNYQDHQDKSNSLLAQGIQTATTRYNNNNNSNPPWNREAPSTIVPYAVIEACNLTLDKSKKEFV